MNSGIWTVEYGPLFHCNSPYTFNGASLQLRVNRAVASYVTTVNQLYISLLILGYLCYLPRLCGKRVVSLYNELRNESSLELKFYYVNYCYSAVIALGKPNEYCAEIMS